MHKVTAFLNDHPRLASWIVLAIGMVVILALSATGKGLLPGQLAGLAAACIVFAGICAWIIGWE
jgi:quinol-cytochrome oxidoreductase complex cytochrome b subunit